MSKARHHKRNTRAKKNKPATGKAAVQTLTKERTSKQAVATPSARPSSKSQNSREKMRRAMVFGAVWLGIISLVLTMALPVIQ